MLTREQEKEDQQITKYLKQNYRKEKMHKKRRKTGKQPVYVMEY